MMHNLRKIVKKAWRAPLWLLFVLTLASASVSVIALRHNNQTMVKLRGALYTADKNNSDVNGALNNLRDYVYGHMNTNLSSGGNAIKPPIQLKYTYERLQAAEQTRVDAVNSQIYTNAENYCQSINQAYFGTTRVPCVQDYVSIHGGVQATPIPIGLYQFDFLSPSWSPDLAGWSLLAVALLAVWLAARVIISRLAEK